MLSSKVEIAPSVVTLSEFSNSICGLSPLSASIFMPSEKTLVAEKVATPSTCRVDAMSTAPSMSTTSKLVVPSTSISPDISKEPNEPTPVVVIAEAPLLIVPKLDVIDPVSKAPVVSIPVPPAIGLKIEPTAVPPIVIASASNVPSKSPSTASMLHHLHLLHLFCKFHFDLFLSHQRNMF